MSTLVSQVRLLLAKYEELGHQLTQSGSTMDNNSLAVFIAKWKKTEFNGNIERKTLSWFLINYT